MSRKRMRRIYGGPEGWVLCACKECKTLNYVEPHGTTAECKCSRLARIGEFYDETEHENIPYNMRVRGSGGTMVYAGDKAHWEVY